MLSTLFSSVWFWVVAGVGSVGYLTSLAFTLREVATAPMGYEDADGFHVGLPAEASADNVVALPVMTAPVERSVTHAA